MVSETNGWEPGGADAGKGKTHMDAQTKRLERESERGRAGWEPITPVTCSAAACSSFASEGLQLPVVIVLRLNFRRNYGGAGVSLSATCVKRHAEGKLN